MRSEINQKIQKKRTVRGEVLTPISKNSKIFFSRLSETERSSLRSSIFESNELVEIAKQMISLMRYSCDHASEAKSFKLKAQQQERLFYAANYAEEAKKRFQSFSDRTYAAQSRNWRAFDNHLHPIRFEFSYFLNSIEMIVIKNVSGKKIDDELEAMRISADAMIRNFEAIIKKLRRFCDAFLKLARFERRKVLKFGYQ